VTSWGVVQFCLHVFKIFCVWRSSGCARPSVGGAQKKSRAAQSAGAPLKCEAKRDGGARRCLVGERRFGRRGVDGHARSRPNAA